MARLRVLGVRVERHAGRIVATVTLGRNGGVATGQVERPAAEGPRAAAEAAVEALRQIAPAGTRWALAHAGVSAVRAGRAVIVQIDLETEDGAEHLIGSSLSHSTALEEAAARAVVDAVDRRLGWLIRT